MQKSAIKDLIYGGVEEILNNKAYYYHSSMGAEYSHFTDEGKIAIAEFIDLMAFKIREANEADLNERAKKQTIAALKG